MGKTVESWLRGLGLQRYADVFHKNDIGMRALPHVMEEDLAHLGVSLGHRRLLMAAITDLTAKPTAAEQSQAAAVERRHLTAFFADLAGYTEMTNRYGPEKIRRLIQDYQDTVARSVSRFGGNIAKYLGDGLLVYFGWPVAYEDHSYRALAAGLDTLQRAQQLKAPDGSPISVRIGVASGLVVVGDLVGQSTREEGAVTGHIMNLAARLQAQAPVNSLIIPADMKPLLGNAFTFKTLGPLHLKGFDTPQDALQVLGETRAESRFHSLHHAYDNRIVGRAHERGMLEQIWARVRAGSGEAVVLFGEAGIGKSRLVEDFLDRQVPLENTDIIRLNGSPYFTTTPFHPVADRISHDADLAPIDTPEEMAAKLRDLLERRSTPDLDRVLSVYAMLAAPQARVAAPVASLAPAEQKELISHTLLEVIRIRASVKPVLIVVEDAHWIDPSTARLMDRIVATCSEIPIMVLLTHRPEWDSGWQTRHSNATILHLSSLDAVQAAELVAQVTTHVPDQTIIAEIINRTDGVPLFIEEVARTVCSNANKAPTEVPASLQGAMMARLDLVPEDAKIAAQMASVFGREFSPDLLARVMDCPESAVMSMLAELCRSGLIYESDQRRDAYIFHHALLRDTAYHSMVSEDLKNCHLRVAEALLDLRPALVAREPELAARHFSEAGQHQPACTYWRAAAEKALARSAGDEAAACAEASLTEAKHLGNSALSEQITALILIGRSHENTGRLSDALDTLHLAAQMAQDAGLDALVSKAGYWLADASLMFSTGVEAAYETCFNALKKVPPEDEPERCRLLSQLARCAMHLGRFSQSAEYSKAAVSLASRLGDSKAQFAVMMSRLFAPVAARDLQEVTNWRSRLADMQDLADTLGDIDRGRDRSLRFYVAMEMGDRDLAEKALDSLNQVGQTRNHPQLNWISQHARAMLAILDGDFAGAEAYAKTALKIGHQTHGTHVEGVYGMQMFTLRREQARLHEVAPVIRRLLDDHPDEMAWKPGFGVVAAELGHKDAARRILVEIANTGFDLPLDALYSTTLAYLADICTEVCETRMAAQIYELLLPYRDITVMAGVTTVCNGAAGRRLGALAALMGDWQAMEDHFETALALDSRMRAAPWAAHTRSAYACALRRRGRPQDEKAATLLSVAAMEAGMKYGMTALTTHLRGQVN
ncbi:ATP-binding protein [Pseudophaeobacter profundi]|uniref:ATP-binding protein n=1 Tax=Pseudophaeobacter profundi TaxID=3034152 RepID=UPI00242E7686|nr:AAA family ATPase [Pseudophaeobacter profundi]